MAAAPRFDWEKIRAEYEAGASMGSLSRAYGVSKPSISVRAKKEGWIQDTTEAVNRLVNAKLNGVANPVSPEKKAEALSAAADRKMAVIVRHQDEWRRHQAIIDEALANNDFERAKLAKITAETIRIRQDGERRAWGIELTQQQQVNQQAQVVNIDFSTRSQTELIALVREAYGTAQHDGKHN